MEEGGAGGGGAGRAIDERDIVESETEGLNIVAEDIVEGESLLTGDKEEDSKEEEEVLLARMELNMFNVCK